MKKLILSFAVSNRTSNVQLLTAQNVKGDWYVGGGDIDRCCMD